MSPDGRFELVIREYSYFLEGLDVIRIRSRSGLWSRESGQDLACFVKYFDPVESDPVLDTARFVDDHEIEIRTKTGERWTTRFDPNTMLADATLDNGCRR